MIGNGNVALDVARVLAKSADEMAKSDIVPEAGAAIAAAPITDIYVIGRRGPEHASFTNNELAEMGRLARAVGGDRSGRPDVRAAGRRSDARAAAQGQEPRDPARLRGERAGQQADHAAFRLHAAPLRSPARSSSRPAAVDLVITCIGYSRRRASPRARACSRSAGRRRGPTGTIPTNRAESHAVAQEVMAWLKERDPKSGPDPMPAARSMLAGWHRIDKAEIAAGARRRPAAREIDGLAGAVGRRARVAERLYRCRRSG